MGSGKYLRRAVEKYGLENFSKEILFVYDSEDLMNAKEAELVTEEFCLREDTYNICEGGKGGWSYINNQGLNIGVKFINENGLNNKNSQYKITSEKIKSNSVYALEFSEKISQGLKRRIEEGRFKYTPHNHSEKTKKKMSESKKGDTNFMFGKMWITDGQNNRPINKTDTIPEGWVKGRKV